MCNYKDAQISLFRDPVEFQIALNPGLFVVEDLNGDGIPDVATPSLLGNVISVLFARR